MAGFHTPKHARFLGQLCCGILTLQLANGITAAEPTASHIAIDLKRGWEFSLFSPSGVPSANQCQVDLSKQFAKFTCNQTGARGTFQYPFSLPFEMQTYPRMVLKYRATNIDTANTFTFFWIEEGENSATIPLIDFDKLIADGDEHEIEIDLPSAPTNSAGTPFEKGLIKGVSLSIMNSPAGAGTIELLELDFHSLHDEKKAAADDAPLTVHVADEAGQPIARASVIIDGERKDFRKSAEANADGEATLRPLKNEEATHSVEVSAIGFVSTTTVTKEDEVQAEIQLTKAMEVGGRIVDENGKPIAGARVALFSPDPAKPRGFVSSSMIVYARTNPHGEWLSPPIPHSDVVQLQVYHPDYISDKSFAMDRAPIDELRAGISTITLKRK